jgi:tRNA threonylcarbamoyladenosine biosynthesis protein TsaE
MTSSRGSDAEKPRPPAGETIETRSAAETEGVGRRIGETLPGGTVVLLVGDLGAGKTAFVRGLAAGLGIDPSDVSSPTFTLVQEYRGRCRLQHVDLYRLSHWQDIEELGIDEFVAHGDVVAIEWADRLPAPPPGALRVEIGDLGGDTRRITVSWCRLPGGPDSDRTRDA